MTSTPVMGSISSQAANLLNVTQTINKTGGADFKDFMNRQDTGVQPTADKPAMNGSDNKDEAKLQSETPQNPDDKIRTDSKPAAKEAEVTDKDVDTATQAINEVVEAIKEEFKITDEELTVALTNLGLTFAALLNTDNIPAIVAEISGSEDVMEIATNPELYESLTAITDTVEETVKTVLEELDIPEEDFKEALVQAETIPETTEITFERPEKIEVKEKADFESKVEVNVAPEMKEAEPVRRTETRNTETVRPTFNGEDTTETETLTIRPEAEFNERDEFEGRSDTNQAPMSFAQNLINRVVEAFNETQETASYSEIDVQDVLNQITESIRVEITPETSEINLRLHPESLGSVTVKVSTTSEGVMRAQFTTQNESVRAIVESQALVLKESLEQKGMTVEAVEVTVQSHQFERNLSDQNRGGNPEGQPKRRGIRRINLSETADEAETEAEDTIVREMMAQNGNTIDYSA